jgi:hypothetical protein
LRFIQILTESDETPANCTTVVVNKDLSVYLQLQGDLNADAEREKLRKKKMKFKSKCTCLLSPFLTVNILMFQCCSILSVTCLLSYTQATKCTGTENGRLWVSREGSTERVGGGHEKAHRFVGITRGHQ